MFNYILWYIVYDVKNKIQYFPKLVDANPLQIVFTGIQQIIQNYIMYDLLLNRIFIFIKGVEYLADRGKRNFFLFFIIHVYHNPIIQSSGLTLPIIFRYPAP